MLSIAAKDLARELDSTPGVGALQTACRADPEIPAYLVGGAVRDLLSGRPRGELDVATEHEVGLLAERLGGSEISHERFGTASLELEGIRLDLARTRSEFYPRPGALPEVEPAPLDADLGRRDFTVNAMAIPLHEDPRLVDPHGGRGDLERGLLRVLHDRSFVDDPTRVIRAARYVARLGMQLEDETRRLAAAAELGTVSSDRVDAELARLAVEPNPERGFALLTELGIDILAPGASDRVAAVARLFADNPTWSALADPARAILAAAKGQGLEEAQRLAEAGTPTPSEGAGLAEGAEPTEVVLGRALGADWLDRWLGQWREMTLEINGEDLIAAGLEPGPAIGRGLRAALKAKLDGEVSGREAELEIALRAARAE